MEDLGERRSCLGAPLEPVRVAVVGAGWAGLAAALRLRRARYEVSVYDSAATAGGRARRVRMPAFDADLDNGQHILLGAYTATLELMKSLALPTETLFRRIPLSIAAADGSFELRAPPLPAPLNLLAGILTAKGMDHTDRWSLIRSVARLRAKSWKVAAGATVKEWLAGQRQSTFMVDVFWRPLCVAALNTPIELACAQLFSNVLRDSLGGGKHATDMLLPCVDLSSLWPDTALHYLRQGAHGSSAWHPAHTVRCLRLDTQGVYVDEEHYDAVVLAGNLPSTKMLLSQLPACQAGAEYLADLSAFTFLPISTLTLELAAEWSCSEPMLLLKENAELLQFGQWLFNRKAYAASAPEASLTRRLLHVVVSDARAMLEHDKNRVVSAMVEQVRTQARRFGPIPEVVRHHVITEKRATFSAVPGLRRPPNATPWANVWVAGDWTDTGYPAVLEGAVLSGQRAADDLHRTTVQRGEGLRP